MPYWDGEDAHFDEDWDKNLPDDLDDEKEEDDIDDEDDED